MSTVVLQVLWNGYDALCARELNAQACVAKSLIKIDAERAVRSLGQIARHSLAAWKRETARGA